MPIVNLKRQYPHLYDEILLDVSDPIFEVYDLYRRKESAHQRKLRYNRSFYSLDAGNGIETEVLHREPSPEEIWLQQVRREQLREALEHLPPIQSRRVYAHYMLGAKKREIARKEGVSVSAVHCSIHSGLKNLKRYYDQHFQGEREG